MILFTAAPSSILREDLVLKIGPNRALAALILVPPAMTGGEVEV
jgi:hypothetical protein